MFGLQARLTLAFLLLASILVGTGGWVLYGRIQHQFHSDFQDRVKVATYAAKRRLDREAELLRARVEGVVNTAPVRELLQDLNHDRVPDDVATRRRLHALAESLRTGAGLDVLWIIDLQKGSRVLAAPHAAAGTRLPDAVARFTAAATPDRLIVSESIRRGGPSRQMSLIEVSVKRERLVLVGGRVIGQAVAKDLQMGGLGEIHVTLVTREGHILASTLDRPTTAPAGFETAAVVQHNPGDSVPALRVLVHVDQSELQVRIATLIRSMAMAAGGAVLLALILGGLIARRISSPVRMLVEATRQVAQGQRELDLPRDRRDEIGVLITAFRDMTEQLSESEKRLRSAERIAAWQEIARELAHEIKNPLTPVQMAIETIRRAHARNHEQFDEIFDESTLTILEEVDRLKTIVSDFSQFARLPNPKPRLCCLNDVVHQAVVLYRENSEHADVLEHLDPELGDQMIDPERMAQVIQNLLKNAIQATTTANGDRVVKVRTTRLNEREVELVVSDNGCGIAPDDLERVFTPYFTSKAGGTGLGLAVVQRIVFGHNGKVGVSSTQGKGTEFKVILPRA